jgi:hypothetical protein
MPHRVLAVDGVPVAAPYALDLHVARIDELGDDPLSRALGDAHPLRRAA